MPYAMPDLARELSGFEPQPRKGDPAGVDAMACGLLQMPERVVNQQGSAPLQLGFQMRPQNAGGLWSPGLVNHHVFNRDDCMQMPIQAQFLAQGHGIFAWRVGEHDAHAIQGPKTMWHTAMAGTQSFQICELMCVGQKMVRFGLMVTHHSEQGSAVAQPVPGSQLAGLLMVQLKVIRKIAGHLAIDLGQNVGRCKVHGIVQIQ